MRALAVAVALATGCAGGAFNPAYRVDYGSALAPPGTSRGMSSTIVYRDYAGPLGKLLLLFLLSPVPPSGKSTITIEKDCAGEFCTETTTTVTEGPTQAALDKYAADVDKFNQVTGPAIVSGAMAVEGELAVTSTRLGGDTEGFRLGALGTVFATHGTGWNVSLEAGGAYQRMTIHGRTTPYLVGDRQHVHIERMTGDLISEELAVPIRFKLGMPHALGAYTQFDWNFERMFYGPGAAPGETYHPQPTHFGFEAVQHHVRLAVELMIDQLHTGSTTFSAEAGLVF